MLVIAVAGVLAPHDPFAVAGPRLRPPNGDFLLGTDSLGRDVLSRVLYGARLSLPIALATIMIAALSEASSARSRASTAASSMPS